MSCRFITAMPARLKVPAKNSPALLFLSRGKEEERKTTTISCFAPAEEEQSRGILGGNFQTCVHDGNKAAGPKVTTWFQEHRRVPLVAQTTLQYDNDYVDDGNDYVFYKVTTTVLHLFTRRLASFSSRS